MPQVLYNLVLDRMQGLKLFYTLCMIFFPKKNTKAVLLIDAENGGEVLSKGGKAQGDPTSMRTYTLSILAMLHSMFNFVLTNDLQTIEVVIADDLSVARKLAGIKNF